MSVSRRICRLAPALFVVGVLVWVGWTWWSVRSVRGALTEIDGEMKAGRFGLAARHLEKLLAHHPDSDETAYVLGLCEQTRGRPQEADKAWARVVPGSAFSQRAILARLRLFHDTGRLAAAEQLLIDAANDPRNDRTDMLVMLVPIYSETGRNNEAERLIEARWEHLKDIGEATPEQSIKLVRLHIELNAKALSVDNLRLYLDQVGRMAPDDDRVWLGKANLAIQTGAHDDARRWLEACRRKRPDDLAVWRAWLNWGMAANRIDVVEQAVKHLPAAESSLVELHRLKAWLAARGGDLASERRELEQLVATDPADQVMLDRLVQLAEKDRQPDRAAELLSKKAEIDRLRARYLKLYERTQHMRDAEEMARLAEQLGRWFEARVFLTLAVADEPQREDLRRELSRLSQSPASVGERGQNLADVLADELSKNAEVK